MNMEDDQSEQTTVLEPLFELTLKPERGSWNDGEPDTSPEGRVGPYIASGHGTVDGPKVRGSVTWDLFEDQELDTIHPSDMAGLIETDDGARIEFQTLGILVPEDSEKMRWAHSAAMRFKTRDERYAWLNTVLAFMTGTFDSEVPTSRYRITSQRTR